MNPVEAKVRERYAEGAGRAVAELCCPVEYDPRYLEAIPSAVLERDYGCGDPSRYLRPGETVLLSPACASWDMYRNFTERGDSFKALVRALPG